MSLALLLTRSGASYYIQAEKLDQTAEFNPIVQPLPTTGTATEPIAFNLGQFRHKFTFSGILDNIAHTEGGVTVPSKNELEDFLLTNLGTSITTTIYYTNTTIAPATTTSHVYQIHIQNYNFEIVGGAENRWQFSISGYGGKRTSS